VLECAVSAGADYIVTGDKDLLRLKQYDAIQRVWGSFWKSRSMLAGFRLARPFFKIALRVPLAHLWAMAFPGQLS
jgi:hypothetical protein